MSNNNYKLTVVMSDQHQNEKQVIYAPEAPSSFYTVETVDAKNVRAAINAVIENHVGWWDISDPLFHLITKSEAVKDEGTIAIVSTALIQIYELSYVMGDEKIQNADGVMVKNPKVMYCFTARFKSEDLHSQYGAFELFTDQRHIVKNYWAIVAQDVHGDIQVKMGSEKWRYAMRRKHDFLARIARGASLKINCYPVLMNKTMVEYSGRINELRTILSLEKEDAAETLRGFRHVQTVDRIVGHVATQHLIQQYGEDFEEVVEKGIEDGLKIAVVSADLKTYRSHPVADVVGKKGYVVTKGADGWKKYKSVLPRTLRERELFNAAQDKYGVVLS